MEENIEYYRVRIEFVKKLFRNHETGLLRRNADKIQTLVDSYNTFKNHPKYDSALVGAIQTFIF